MSEPTPLRDWMAALEAQIAADEREDRRESLQTFDGWADTGVQARWSDARVERR